MSDYLVCVQHSHRVVTSQGALGVLGPELCLASKSDW